MIQFDAKAFESKQKATCFDSLEESMCQGWETSIRINIATQSCRLTLLCITDGIPPKCRLDNAFDKSLSGKIDAERS